MGYRWKPNKTCTGKPLGNLSLSMPAGIVRNWKCANIRLEGGSMCRVSMLRYVPKRNVPKKNAQGILQGAWMPHMGSMACSEVDPQPQKITSLNLKKKETLLRLADHYHTVAWMSCIQSGKIRMHKIAGKFRLPQGMLSMFSRYEIQDLKLRWPWSEHNQLVSTCSQVHYEIFSAFDNHYRTTISRWVVQEKMFQPRWPYSGCYVFPTCKQFLEHAAQPGWEAGLYASTIHSNSEGHLVHCQNLQAPLRVFKDNIVVFLAHYVLRSFEYLMNFAAESLRDILDMTTRFVRKAQNNQTAPDNLERDKLSLPDPQNHFTLFEGGPAP